jgi:hypothetical protein
MYNGFSGRNLRYPISRQPQIVIVSDRRDLMDSAPVLRQEAANPSVCSGDRNLGHPTDAPALARLIPNTKIRSSRSL